MNEKQAREILNCKSTGGCPHSTGDIVKAEGYLEGIEKAKGLEEALFKMQKEIDKWKALAGELYSSLSEWKLILNGSTPDVRLETKSIPADVGVLGTMERSDNALAKARAFFDDSEKRGAGLK